MIREKDGHPVRIADVARVEDGEADAETIANIDGTPTVLLDVRRQSGTNTVEVVKAVRERLDETRATLPPGYNVRIVRDLSEFIEASIHSVEEHLIVGSFLAALVVLFFLGNLRSTIIAAIAIPTSIIATFGLVWYMGFTLNALTMLALTLAVGIVIDDAIVVLENIYRFIEEKGVDPYTAAVEATREIGLAVLATTLSLVAIFVPVGFMGGIVGRFMKSFGLTMAFAIMVSLLVSFTLTPMLSARWLKVDGKNGKKHSSKDSRLFKAIDAVYARMLEWSMAHRAIVAIVAVLVLFSSVPLFMIANKNFIPNDDQSEFEINLRAPEGTSLESTEVLTNRVAAAVRRQVPEVSYTLVTIGGDPSHTRNLASIYVRLTPLEQRRRDQFEVMSAVRSDVLPPLTEHVRTSVQQVATIGGGGSQNADVQFLISGPDLKVLEQLGHQLVEKTKSVPGIVDVDSTLNVGKPEMSVQIDRPKAADVGVQIGDAAEALRLLVGGDQVTTFNEGSEQYEVHLRARAENRSTEQAIASLAVPSSKLGSIPLENVATFATRTRSGGHQPAGPAAPGHHLRERPADGVAGGSAGRDPDGIRAAEARHRVPRRTVRPFERTGARRAELPAGVRALAGLHVSDPGGAVRIVAAPDHDSAVTAADAAVCAPVDHHLPAVAEYLLGARPAGAVRGGQEEFDSADRSRQPAEGVRASARTTPSSARAAIGCGRF